MNSKSHRFVGLDLGPDNAFEQVNGAPVFIDDIGVKENPLQVYVAGSRTACGKIIKLDLNEVEKFKGVEVVLKASDIPGENKTGTGVNDLPVLADKQILYYGQPLFAVAAQTIEIAKAAAKLAVIKYQVTDPVVDINQAIKQKSNLSADVVLKRGRSAPAIKNALHKQSGHFSIGAQEHFYLEGQIAMAIPKPIDQLVVYSSTQNTFDLRQSLIQSINHDDLIVESFRLGGSFGGKQTQSVQWAIIAALVAHKSGQPAVVRLDRTTDMIMTGKGHDFAVDYDVGFDDKGIIQGVEITLASRCGCSEDLSALVNDYALLHIDNAYYLKNITVTSKRYKTNTVTSTVLRGSGKAQGILAIERIIDEIAAVLGHDPLKVRMTNLYGDSSGRITPYGMRITDDSLSLIIDELKRTSTYQKRSKAIARFNVSSPIIKRGIALIPVKYGVSAAKLNQSAQSSAFVNVEHNGLIQVHICGAEMGQGLFTKITQIVAEVFQVEPSQISINSPRTDMFADMPTTTGSSSVDLNGRAVQRAAEKLKQRLIEFATKTYVQPESKIRFTAEGIKIGRKTVQFKTLVNQALTDNLKLSSNDSFAADNHSFDSKKGKGQPFSYFINGAAVAEVALDSLTGESKVKRVDILQDCGQSINPLIDIGQIEGGFIQGMGWMTMEELLWDQTGELLTDNTSTYKIPVCSDVPEQFNVRIWKHGKNDEHAIFNSKVVGELPLVLAISVYSAIIQAVASVKSERGALPKIDIPATPEKVLMALQND